MVFLALVPLVACSMTGTRKESLGPGARPRNQTCVAPPRPAARVRVIPAFPRLRFDEPVALVASPDHAWWFVAERRGRVWRIPAHDEGIDEAELVLDISDRVEASTAAIGLLAIALHPSFSTTGALFVSYTGVGGTLALSRVSRFTSSDGGRTFDRAREQRMIEIDQISDYHVNTDLQFGPDGHLYVGFGDGGPQGDPHRRAQDPFSLQGKILRLDVDRAKPYAIPDDNPFARDGGAPEVWALGLRNPWRFAFDRETGALWAGDVGEDRVEEVNRIERAGNYGWSLLEGTRCVKPGTCTGLDTIAPVAALPHPNVSSVTFGVAYRGSAIPDMRGHLIYADYASGVIYELDPSASVREPRIINNDGHAVVSFAEDGDGEPLVVDLAGALWRIVPGNEGAADIPALLSQTGCFKARGEPVAALIPYEVNIDFWSDASTKQRWLAVPDGTSIRVGAEGRLELPPGTVLAKEFSFDGLRVETRLYVRHRDGGWAGYTYRWDPTQQDARLIPSQAQGTKTAWPRNWYFPHRGECSRCHQAAAGHALGLELAQLDREVERDDGTFDQLEAFERIGLFSEPLPATMTARALPPLSSDASVERRARAWLHVNCAYCHLPGGSGQGSMDLRFTTPLAEMGVCDVPPKGGSFGTPNARIVAPGDPQRSILLRRIRSRGFIRMPPIGALGTDPQGIALVEQWIAKLECE